MGDYRKLQVWEKAMTLAKEIYILTQKFSNDEKFGLVSQMRRCVVSIPSNIAEGKLRGSDLEFKRFLLIAFASGGELETQLELSCRLGFLKEEKFNIMNKDLEEIMKMLNVLIKKLKAKS